ncbi:hypothetical protein A2230_07060 [candidate division WOR-1 bacterium RIFOXYA2_FULL_36_21]|uniref:SMP-30/Gluconolactonase/LRE-like region domain-containing protein n=1 Tax=candidate division WOR-1 bacterium RIFOXYB2_FULL_36_35 TaxID=1802578 RepID=A0A1F4S8Q2_UNCSA|nr:MAG: hypothetical protein A2230_07060 [candidate division WOR-1 bacterium RIFOXYA2_FULL_36_21]OGC16767.1 MAG: hypothetical protein A2290_00215 [candidate division WOR-1 bacterium RIFOXYB2_FULL_36_35]OGC19735.1 MAG: hypothetical protein A2282_08900 [candidate division WOR-1 bacterium RIFOXYA12_FULL_36_13]
MKKVIFVLILIVSLSFQCFSDNLGIKSPANIAIDKGGNICFIIFGKWIAKFDLLKDFAERINQKTVDAIDYSEKTLICGKFLMTSFEASENAKNKTYKYGKIYKGYINNLKPSETEVGFDEVQDKVIIPLSKYFQVQPSLEAILDRVIYPQKITLGSDGNIYAIGEDVFRKNYRIGIIDPNDGHTIFTFGKTGTGEADLWFPKDIAVDSDGIIYVTNHVYSKEGYKLYAVKKYDKSGKFLGKFGTWGGGGGEFKDPWAITIDNQNGYVYVSDSFYPSWMRGTGYDHPQERIQKFTKDGKFLKSWGGNKISGFSIYPPALMLDPDFSDPIGMVVDSQGYVYVLEDDRARVSKFDENGKLILRWGKPGTGQGEFLGPQGISIDKDDNIYIADTKNDRIQKFDSNGKFLMEVK